MLSVNSSRDYYQIHTEVMYLMLNACIVLITLGEAEICAHDALPVSELMKIISTKQLRS